MDAGTLIWILLIGGGVLAMVFMHRGGHAGGGMGGGGCGGHGRTSTEEPPRADATPVGSSGSHDGGHEPAAAGGKHRGC